MSAKDINLIKKSLDSKMLVIGRKETIKNIKLGNLTKIYLSKNCPEVTKIDIKKYSKIGKIDSSVIDKSNEDLGVICKKPFSISVLSVLKEKKE